MNNGNMYLIVLTIISNIIGSGNIKNVKVLAEK